MEKEEIGRILKNLRLNSGKTQKEVGELLGRSQQIVGHWETGYAQPDANTLFLLCSIYDADMNQAFGFERKKSSTPAEAKVKDETFRKVFAERLTEALIFLGLVKEGEDITEGQAIVLQSVFQIISVTFGKNENRIKDGFVPSDEKNVG